jgi:transposase InsO family protein
MPRPWRSRRIGFRRIIRPGRKPVAPKQSRKSQPGSYSGHWSDTVGEPADWVPAPHYGSIQEAPRDLLERALSEKQPWVQRFVEDGCPRGKLKEYARAYASAMGIGQDEIPPYSTLNTWAHQYKAYGTLGLIDKVRKDVGGSKVIPEEMQHLLEVAYLGGKLGVKAAARFVAGRMDPGEVPPDIHAFYRAIRRLRKHKHHLVVAAREGMGRVKSAFRLAGQHMVLPGGLVLAIDSTVADIWVKIQDLSMPSGYRVMRPVLTLVQDLGTRMIVTFNYALHPVNTGIIKGTFLRAVHPATNFEGLLSTGIPEVVVTDRGTEHRGPFDTLLDVLGVDHVTSSEPEGRAYVERAIGTLTTELFASLTGYSRLQKPYNPYARPEHDDRRDYQLVEYDTYKLEIPSSKSTPSRSASITTSALTPALASTHPTSGS